MDEDVGVVEGDFEAFGIRHEVGREIALVELHAFHHVERGFDALGFLNSDRSIFADLVHRIGDDLADRGIPVGGDGCNLGDFRAVLDLFGDLGDFIGDRGNSLRDTTLEAGRIGSGRHVLEAFAIDRFGENCGGRGAVTGDVAGLARDFADKLRTHVFIGALELDFFRNRHTVLGDRRAAEFLVEDDVASRWPEGRLDGFRQFLDTAEKRLAGCFVE